LKNNLVTLFVLLFGIDSQMDDAVEAYKYVETRQKIGNVLLIISDSE
jgi:hypothetical protein